ncbi:MAG: helix-turn-helix domain-containing protein [Firmicutes bacterium]|nr:helix-turn-helix domain-containing protein [Bacillota bacterium]
MDNIKIGNLIYKLRKEKQLTQLQLAEHMNISDKTVSKWERGLGCPDISLLSDLSKIFNIDIENLLSGELDANNILGGNMKKINFYICPNCENIITSTTDASISCCGKKLKISKPQKADNDHNLTVEIIENEFYITSDHPMTKDHHITFVALLTSDSMILKKQYSEWDLQTRIPILAHSKLLWYCTQHGLFYQETRNLK